MFQTCFQHSQGKPLVACRQQRPASYTDFGETLVWTQLNELKVPINITIHV